MRTSKMAKPSKMRTLGLSLLAGLSLVAGCATTSHRDTPVVRVIQAYAPNVVNIRTEMVIDLKELPEWGLYGEQLDKLFKLYYGEDYSEGTLRDKSLGSGCDRGWGWTHRHQRACGPEGERHLRGPAGWDRA